MRTDGTFRLAVCNNASTNVLNALQLGEITSRYNRQSRHKPIETVLGQLQLMLPHHQSVQHVCRLRALRWKNDFLQTAET